MDRSGRRCGCDRTEWMIFFTWLAASGSGRVLALAGAASCAGKVPDSSADKIFFRPRWSYGSSGHNHLWVRRPDSERLQSLSRSRKSATIDVVREAIDAVEGRKWDSINCRRPGGCWVMGIAVVIWAHVASKGGSSVGGVAYSIGSDIKAMTGPSRAACTSRI